jgi:hypothetical protein
VRLHALGHESARRAPAAAVRRNGLLQLGMPHFWLLSSILGGIIAIVIVVLFASLLAN